MVILACWLCYDRAAPPSLPCNPTPAPDRQSSRRTSRWTLPCSSRPPPAGPAQPLRMLWPDAGAAGAGGGLGGDAGALPQRLRARRRRARGRWPVAGQSVRFHFTRLEDDLQLLARQAVQSTSANTPPPAARATQTATPSRSARQQGLLWNEPGAVLWHGWQPRQHTGSPADTGNSTASRPATAHAPASTYSHHPLANRRSPPPRQCRHAGQHARHCRGPAPFDLRWPHAPARRQRHRRGVAGGAAVRARPVHGQLRGRPCP